MVVYFAIFYTSNDMFCVDAKLVKFNHSNSTIKMMDVEPKSTFLGL